MEFSMKKIVLETIKAHRKLVDQLEQNCTGDIVKAAELIIDSLKKGGCVYICGNGGSAADAQHIAGELVGRFLIERNGLAAVALTTDTSVITSIANDYGYNDIFRRQVDGLVKKDDVLWALSTSGTSANIIAAAKLAKERGTRILAFTGKPDTPLEKMSDVCLAIDTANTYSAQEIHQLAYHMICNLVEQAFAK